MPDDQTLATILAICDLMKHAGGSVESAVEAYPRAMKDVMSIAEPKESPRLAEYPENRVSPTSAIRISSVKIARISHVVAPAEDWKTVGHYQRIPNVTGKTVVSPFLVNARWYRTSA